MLDVEDEWLEIMAVVVNFYLDLNEIWVYDGKGRKIILWLLFWKIFVIGRDTWSIVVFLVVESEMI